MGKQSVKSLLSTTEVIELTGVSRWSIRHYLETGVVAPTLSKGNRAHWSYAQVMQLLLVDTLERGGYDIAAIAQAEREEGPMPLDSALDLVLESTRSSRRKLKALRYEELKNAQFEPCGVRDGYYLRYFPERFMALLPVSTDASHDVGMASYAQQVANLMGIVDVAGWSFTFSHGTVKSLDENGDAATNYIFNELATPPQPYLTIGACIDGGCYQQFGVDGCPEYANIPCKECARYGRAPSEKELFTWKHATITNSALDRTVRIEELAEPYATGLWASYTQDVLAGEGERYQSPIRMKPPFAGRADGDAGNKTGAGSETVRPRLMPQDFELPLGATAGVIPAGYYLCKQGITEEIDADMQQLIGALQVFPRRTLTLEDELAESARRSEAARKHAAERMRARERGFSEPFALPRQGGDPALFGFCQSLSAHELGELTLLTNTGFPPEDGFLIIHQELPFWQGGDAPTRQEFQVLVDPGPHAARE